MKSAGKARNNGLYRHIRTSKEIIRNLLNDYMKNIVNSLYHSRFQKRHSDLHQNPLHKGHGITPVLYHHAALALDRSCTSWQHKNRFLITKGQMLHGSFVYSPLPVQLRINHVQHTISARFAHLPDCTNQRHCFRQCLCFLLFSLPLCNGARMEKALVPL